MSRRHAHLEQSGDHVVLRDLGSLNGTYVNQERIEEAVLAHGDEVQIGRYRMVFFESAT
ncbi:MAG: hypothetical protein RIQ63_450 [Actinomycetota bacterium]